MVEVEGFWLLDIIGDRSDIVATINIRVGDFRLHGVKVRRPHGFGQPFVSVPGKGTSGISLAMGSKTRDAIRIASLNAYADATGHRW